MTTRDWLLADSPTSRFQANMGRAYRMGGALLRNPLAVVGALIIILLIATAAFAPWIAPESPVGQNLGARLLPPSGDHWMGTDELGRDIFSRVVYGARITLLIVAMVAVISAPLGLIIGAISGYFGGWVDKILMGLTDVFLSLPRLVLALAFVAALGPGIENADHRHRYRRMAGLRADRAGRDVLTFRETRNFMDGDPNAGRRVAVARIISLHVMPLCHVFHHRAGDAGHGRDHPDRRGSWVSWSWRATAACRNGAR